MSGTRDRSGVLAVVLVLLAAAAVALMRPEAGSAGSSPPATPAGPVTRTQLGCPEYSSGAGVATSVRLGLAPVAGLAGRGRVEAGGPVDLVRGRLVEVPDRGGPAVHASGPAAAGLFGFRTDHRPRRSLAVTSCARPRVRWWFSGAGAGLDHSSVLLLANLDPGPAVVDLRVLGPEGEVDTVATKGMVVAPRSERRVSLPGIAPQTDDLTLEVRAVRGRVAASVADALREQPDAAWGRDWLPGVDQASRAPILVGLPATARSRTLLVANPSDVEAVVDLAVSGRSGTFTPTGTGGISVAPGTVEAVTVARAVPAGEPVALRLRSDVPILASVRSWQAGDHSYAGAATTLAGPAVAPLPRGVEATVHLTAGQVAARVDVAAYDVRGEQAETTTLPVGAGATVSWSPRPRSAYLVVTPATGGGSGTVQGAVSYAGSGVAAVPLVDLPVREQRPSVLPEVR